jgi:hypothetical protein
LHGEVEYGRKKDPKNLSEGAEAWDCGLQIMNEKAKAVDIGRAMYTVAEPLCRVNQLWRVTTKDGKKVWEEVGPVELLRSELCGKYMRIDLSYVDCDERG